MKQALGTSAAIIALISLASPAQAQFGSILRNSTRNAASGSDACGGGQGRSNAGSRLLGGMVSGAVGEMAGRSGLSSFVPMAEFGDQLSTAIACRLDPEEQRQAANATLEVTRATGPDGKAEIGASTTWVSETRENVTGTSTVTARDDDVAEGMDCITVTDVVIIDGEETREDKRMCRAPGAARYSIVV